VELLDVGVVGVEVGTQALRRGTRQVRQVSVLVLLTTLEQVSKILSIQQFLIFDTVYKNLLENLSGMDRRWNLYDCQSS
jgi:hypothetical protein